MKIATVEGHAFNCTAGHFVLIARGRGSNTRVAIVRAMERLLRDNSLKGRRVQSFKATISVAEAVDEKGE